MSIWPQITSFYIDGHLKVVVHSDEIKWFASNIYITNKTLYYSSWIPHMRDIRADKFTLFLPVVSGLAYSSPVLMNGLS